MGGPDRIVGYLSELERALPLRGAAAARILSEVRDHLDDSVATLRASGLAADAAAARAIERFGPAKDVAARFAMELRAPRFLARLLAMAALLVAAIGVALYAIYPDPGTAASVPLALAAAALALTSRRYVGHGAGWFERSASLWGWKVARPAGTAVLAAAATAFALIVGYQIYASAQAPRFVVFDLLPEVVFAVVLVGACLLHVVHATGGPRRSS